SIEVVQGGMNTTTSDPACSEEEWSDRNIDIGESGKDRALVLDQCSLVWVAVLWCSMGFVLLYGPVDDPIRSIEVVQGGTNTTSSDPACSEEEWSDGNIDIAELGKDRCPSQCGQGLQFWINVHWCLFVFVAVHWCLMGFVLLYGPVDVQIRSIAVVLGGTNTTSRGPVHHDGEWSDRIIGCITRYAIDIGESGNNGQLRWSEGGRTPLQVIQHALRRSGQMGTLVSQAKMVDFGGPRGDKHHFKGPACHDGEWSDRIIGCITRHAIDIGESGKDGCPSQCGQGLWFWNSVLRSIAIELGGMNTTSSSPACSKGEWSDGNIRIHAIDLGESGKTRSIAIDLGGTNTTSNGPACHEGEWSDRNIDMLSDGSLEKLINAFQTSKQVLHVCHGGRTRTWYYKTHASGPVWMNTIPSGPACSKAGNLGMMINVLEPGPRVSQHLDMVWIGALHGLSRGGQAVTVNLDRGHGAGLMFAGVCRQFPIGSRLTWAKLSRTIQLQPWLIMQDWKWLAQLSSLGPVVGKLFFLFTCQLWIQLDATWLRGSEGKPEPTSLEDAIQSWTLNQTFVDIDCGPFGSHQKGPYVSLPSSYPGGANPVKFSKHESLSGMVVLEGLKVTMDDDNGCSISRCQNIHNCVTKVPIFVSSTYLIPSSYPRDGDPVTSGGGASLLGMDVLGVINATEDNGNDFQPPRNFFSNCQFHSNFTWDIPMDISIDSQHYFPQIMVGSLQLGLVPTPPKKFNGSYKVLNNVKQCQTAPTSQHGAIAESWKLLETFTNAYVMYRNGYTNVRTGHDQVHLGIQQSLDSVTMSNNGFLVILDLGDRHREQKCLVRTSPDQSHLAFQQSLDSLPCPPVVSWCSLTWGTGIGIRITWSGPVLSSHILPFSNHWTCYHVQQWFPGHPRPWGWA
ncbi:hypothetical protein F5J12DRAFT_787408, partial [Pisolithus orientalis]|uniref:uncharacterized protein n=1 Tax=Pisolithus orientalis TaxID=936130 RepID=UPI0022247FC3